jgi:CPA1 family monovalent cation:H+ antiporter
METRVELAQEGGVDPAGVRQTYREVRREVAAVQSRELARMYSQGAIDEATRRRIQRQLDLDDARFSDDH